MPRFSANLSTMFREYPLLDRPGAAAAVGFRCVEMQFPYDIDLEDLAAVLEDHSLAVSVLNVPSGDFAAGGEGNAAISDRRADFRDGVATAKRYADRIGPANVNILAGVPSPEREADTCKQVLAENLHYAAEEFAEIGVQVVVEAINNIDRPGFLLPTAEDVVATMDIAGHPNLAMEFDIYHMGKMGVPVVDTFLEHQTRIGHIQFADAPDRHEPGTGTIDFGAIFEAIDTSAYDGWVAAEYFPLGKTEDGLGWMSDYA